MEDRQHKLSKAIEFAKIAHAGQKYPSGEDFILHPIRVKKILESVGIDDPHILTAALLHSAVIDAGVSIQEIQNNFGDETAYIVEGLYCRSKIQIPLISEEDKYVLRIHKLFIQLAKDIRVLLITLANEVDKIKHTDHLEKKDAEELARKSLRIYAPIAKAVGVYAFTRTLEEEALRILEPERYAFIKNELDKRFTDIEKELQRLNEEICTGLKKEGVNTHTIFRKKGIYSVHKKLLRYHKKGFINSINNIDGIYDLLGICILVGTVEECYKTLAHVQKHWVTIQKEFDDYIANPKPSGYRSLQTAIKLNNIHACEIQIRTHDMHHENEYGSASHFAYKYGSGNKSGQFSWVKELIGLKDNILDSNENNNCDGKIKLFEDTVFVFTPKGELITLPAKSTPVDFAYAVHTDIGNTCTGAKVNGKLVKLDTPLKSGDVVEVIVDKNRIPSADWLDFVQTAEARQHIRRFQPLPR